MSMTREEALAQLEALANYLNSQGIATKDVLKQVIAALSSCPICGGREPRAEGAGIVHMHGKSGYVVPHIKLYAVDGFKDGQLVTAYIFAAEPEEEGA